MWDFRLFPESASSVAPQVDAIYFALVGFSLFITALVCALVVFFGVRYRRGSKASRARGPGHGLWLEVAWSVPLFVVALSIFVWAGKTFYDIRRAPESTDEIFVIARQWMWQFEHADGRREIRDLHVPVGETVKLTMTSEDVIHSFYVPAFRVKMDVLPGRYTDLWFTPTKPGEYHLFCAEYCGTEHSLMTGRVVVMSQSDYQNWISGRPSVPVAPETRAARLIEKHGCNSCHAAGGVFPAPPLEGLFGREVLLDTGETVIADESYLRESIVTPNAKIVAGYRPVMPSYLGQISESDLAAIIQSIRSMSEQSSTGAEQ